MIKLCILLLLFSPTLIENKNINLYDDDEVKIYTLNETESNLTSYNERFVNKTAICRHRRILCKNDKIKICAMRFIKETIEYKVFKNTCYLFVNNLCEYLGHEFHIAEIGFCTDSRSKKNITRRTQSNMATTTKKPTVTITTTKKPVVTNNNNDGTKTNGPKNSETGGKTDKKDHHKTITKLSGVVQRHIQKTTTKRKFEIDEAYDEHPCPHICPNLYSPVCMSVNRGEGKWFKYYTFVNHCLADQFYCIHYKELGPPPSREFEDVQVSNLGWSFCGAYRYLQFARYSEVLSSMGHYGWLAGGQKYSHIMEAHERIPGYG